METTEKTNKGFGDLTKLYQKRAIRALPLLVRQAKASQTILYSDLARELSMPNPRTLNFPLGAVGVEMKILSKHLGRRIPPIQCLVINKHEGIPGKGIGWFVESVDDFKKLPTLEKERIVNVMLSEIFSFNEWDEVLAHYDLKPIVVTSEASLTQESQEAIRKYGSGGEDEQHKLLKNYIARSPELFALPPDVLGETEHLFPSADSLDVLFKNGHHWVGVEVKGPISDDLDINRGLFQCVKYRALLEAEQRLLQQGVDCRQFLVISRSLPPDLSQKRVVLNVQTLVVPPQDYAEN